MAGPSNWFRRASFLRQLDLEEEEHIQNMITDFVNTTTPRPNTRTFIYRDRETSHNQIWKDYFAPSPTYGPQIFRRRFRMRRELFLRIQGDVEAAEQYFTQRPDATGRLGFSSLQKITAALRILAYGSPADREDEYIKIAETTAIESMRCFCKTVIRLYSQQYLRAPNQNDVARLLREGEERGFSGMLGSLDCMHWRWKNCPTAWHGQFTGHTGKPTLILEAVASRDLWIWHAFFGMAGSFNDITVLDHSPLFNDFIKGQTPPCRYRVNGNVHTVPYYLTDGIYPQYGTLMQSIPHPRNPKEKLFATLQESVRKDVERAFGVLQMKWAITHGPVKFWHTDDLHDIMMTCIILHNMIIEDERQIRVDPWIADEDEHIPINEFSRDPQVLGAYISSRMTSIRDQNVNVNLRKDLMDHLWTRHGANYNA